MATIEELDQRVTVLETVVKTTDAPTLKRDLRRVLSLQDDALELLEQMNSRVVANELTATANARTTEAGFANVNARLDRVESEVGQVKVDVAALRRDLPKMLVDAIREARGAGGEGA